MLVRCAALGTARATVSRQSACPSPTLPVVREAEAADQVTLVHSGPSASLVEAAEGGSGEQHLPLSAPAPAPPGPGTPRSLTWCADHHGRAAGGIQSHHLTLSSSEKPEANLWFRSVRDTSGKCQEPPGQQLLGGPGGAGRRSWVYAQPRSSFALSWEMCSSPQPRFFIRD